MLQKQNTDKKSYYLWRQQLRELVRQAAEHAGRCSGKFKFLLSEIMNKTSLLIQYRVSMVGKIFVRRYHNILVSI